MPSISIAPYQGGGGEDNSWWQSSPIADAGNKPDIGKMGNAISGIESGGNYGAIGPVTKSGDRALGKYQVMAANVPQWTREALGREMTPREFLDSPEAQDAVFNHKFGGYVSKYGPEGASKAWFAGEKGMNNPNAKDILGTSVDKYASRFMNAYAGDSANTPKEQQQANPAPQEDWWSSSPVSAAPASDAKSSAEKLASKPSGEVDRGAIDAFARGGAKGVTAGFSDEIRGLAAAGAGSNNEPASLGNLISGTYKYWTGNEDAKRRYDEFVKRERELDAAAAKQHPIASTAGEIAGAIAVPVGASANAAGLGSRMAYGAGTGAVMGGLYGAGEGVGAADTVGRAVTGAAAGALLGGAAPAAIEGVIRAGQSVGRPIANAIRSIRSPEDEAARRVATAISRDMASDPAAAARLSPNEFAASLQSGGPAVMMDLGGDTTRALARSAANTSPEGRAILNRTINDRFEGQAGRVTDWLRHTFNYPNAQAQQEAIETAARTVNRSNYRAAMREGDFPIMSSEIERIIGSPAVVDAMRLAASTGKDRAVAGGYGAFNNAVTVENGLVRFNRGPNGAPTYPNLSFWDAVKRNLDDAANEALRKGRNSEATVIGELSRSLRGELDNIVPAYATARAGAAHFFGAESALEAGQNFVSKNMSSHEARNALARMSDTERQLFQDGFASKLIESLNNVGDRRSILNKIADTPAAREKINIALGPQRAAEIEAGLRIEGIMDLARSAVQGNSTTARQLAELGLAGGVYGMSGGGMNPFNDPSAAFHAALAYGAMRGKNRINENLSRRVAEALVSRDPQVVIRGIRAVARNNNLLSSLRAADAAIARVGAVESPIAGRMSLQTAGRAQSDNEVPGPSGNQ